MIVGTMILLVAAALLGGLYGYKVAFYSGKRQKEQGPPPLEATPFAPYREQIVRLYRQIRDRPCETVTITSSDGLTLYGRYYHVTDGAPLDIGFHGYRSSAFTDFAGGSEISFQMGHNLLLIDQRAHGNSGGHSISFGIKERQDLLCWVEYALERFGPDTKILLYGVSMGASTVLMAADMSLPENVKGIVADCPYAVPMDIILHVGRTNPLPQWLIKPFVFIGAAVFGGFDLGETDVLRAVKDSQIPILILHGQDDAFVPPEMSAAIHAQNPQMVERHTFPGADHALSYLTDTQRYQNLVRAFICRVLEA